MASRFHIFLRLAAVLLLASQSAAPVDAQRHLPETQIFATPGIILLDTNVESPGVFNGGVAAPRPAPGETTDFQIFAPYAAGSPVFEFSFELLPAAPGDGVPFEIVSVRDWNDVALPVGRWGASYAATRLTFDALPVTGHICTVSLRASDAIAPGSATEIALTLTTVSLPPRRVNRMESRTALGWN